MLSEVVIILIITTTAGLLLKLFSICYKSKCSSIDLGFLHIKRAVAIETEEVINNQNNNQGIQL
jgi:hypothetical protein